MTFSRARALTSAQHPGICPGHQGSDGSSASPPDSCVCADTCTWNGNSGASNGFCSDGGPGSEYSVCPLGTDRSDCGPRCPSAPPSSSARSCVCADTCANYYGYSLAADGGPGATERDCGPRCPSAPPSSTRRPTAAWARATANDGGFGLRAHTAFGAAWAPTAVIAARAARRCRPPRRPPPLPPRQVWMGNGCELSPLLHGCLHNELQLPDIDVRGPITTAVATTASIVAVAARGATATSAASAVSATRVLGILQAAFFSSGFAG